MSELKPCPFCGIASNDINDHLIDCWIRWVVAGDNSDLDIEDAYGPRPLEDELRDEIITRLKEDGERLAYHCVRRNHFVQYTCVLCDAYADTIEEIQHDPDCDVLKHRTLMKELN
jgi:hypothetical protein